MENVLAGIELKDLSFSEVIKVLKEKREQIVKVKAEVERSLQAIDFTINTLTGIKKEPVKIIPPKNPPIPRVSKASKKVLPTVYTGKDEIIVGEKKYKKREIKKAPSTKPVQVGEMTFKQRVVELLKDGKSMQPIEVINQLVSQYGLDEKKVKNNIGVVLPKMVQDGELKRTKENKKPYYSLRNN